MNSKSRAWALLLVALSIGGFRTSAAAPRLKVGDPAPALQTGKWIQGEPVKEFAAGKAYIVEFWATWCGPCRVSIPHLNEIANRFKDKGLIVIGQDCWEQDESLVAPFVKKMGEKMTYRVALDNKQGSDKGKMAETWMEAADQGGIPTAFLVDLKGRLAWIGHPMTLEDSVIEAVLAGTFDVQKAAAQFEAEQKKDEQINTAWLDVTRALKEKRWADATAKLADFEKLIPESDRKGLDRIRFSILLGQQDYPAAYAFAQKLSESNQDNASFQNDLAWQIITDSSNKNPDLAVAETFATRGNEVAHGKDPAILDTLARVYFMRGKKTEAIALEEKAIALAKDDDLKKGLSQTLESYRKDELPAAN